MIKSGATHLGQYRLDSKLGSGGMGIVYKATDEKLHREVAIKLLHPHLLQNEDLKERFRREARMHAQLMHPNVVTLLSLYEDGENMAIIMEMIHGKNLKEYLQASQKHSIADLIRISKAILLGLEAAHHIGLVHRDLKPANVLIANSGEIKLMDFGLAKPATGEDDLTQSGATVGSFRYMAPEQILNKPVDTRTDLYAFGILLYQMLTGKLPFDANAQGGGEFEIMEKQVREDPKAPHEINKALPLEISDLVLRLLAKNPDDRPQSCALVRQELDIISQYLSDGVMAPGLMKAPKGASAHSNAQIAKGLFLASMRSIRGWVQPMTQTASNMLHGAATKFPNKAHLQDQWQKKVPNTWKVFVTWGIAFILIALVGWILVSVMSVAERSVKISNPVVLSPPMSDSIKDNQSPSNVAASDSDAKAIVEPVTTAASPETSEATKAVEALPIKPESKPAVTATAKAKPKVEAKKAAAKSQSRVHLATDDVTYKVVRHDGTDATESQTNEFNRGSQVFFEELKAYSGKGGYFTSYKSGQLRLYLDKPVALSRLVIHRASVGRLSFKGGYIKINLQDDKGKWDEVFVREDDDIDVPVTLTKKQLPSLVKGIRFRFRTPEPITIGPIDLVR